MTNHMTTPRPTDPGLTRATEGAILGGVAAGIARRMDISPSWVRLGFIITAFFGGLGALLYVLGWVAIPEDGAERSVAEDFLADRRGSAGWLGLGLIVIAVAVLLGAADLFSFELVLAAVLFLAGFLLYRSQATAPSGDPPTGGGPAPPGGEPPTEPVGFAPAAAVDTADAPTTGPVSTDDAAFAVEPPPAVSAAWTSPVVETYRRADPTDVTVTVGIPPVGEGTAPPVPPPSVPSPPARPRSYLGRLTMAALLITIGTMALLQNIGVADPDLGDYVAAGVLVVGAGLLVGTFFGRARGLIVLGLFAAPLLVLTTAVGIPLGGEWGSETLAPDDVGELEATYEHGVGEFTLDLSSLQLTEDASVSVEQGIGRLVVEVPEDMSLSVDGHVGGGAVIVFGDEEGGFDFSRSYTATVAGQPTLQLDLELGAGAIEIIGN